jgi:hypothetical protein
MTATDWMGTPRASHGVGINTNAAMTSNVALKAPIQIPSAKKNQGPVA